MSSPQFLAVTASGLQNITAFLLLFGGQQQQCEDNVGSALTERLSYATATPLSTFGTPGVITAGVKAVVASFPPSNVGVCGAERLHNAGFKTAGKDLSMIMMDPDSPTRYLAESRLDDIVDTLEKTGFKLKSLSVRPSNDPWITYMVPNTAASCFFSVAAYLPLILNDASDNPFNNPQRWIYPLLKLAGSFLTIVGTQLVIRTRILQILAAKLHFRNLSETMADELEELHMYKEVGGRPRWDSQVMSERCLARLNSRVISKLRPPPQDSDTILPLWKCTPAQPPTRQAPRLRGVHRKPTRSTSLTEPLLELSEATGKIRTDRSCPTTVRPYQLMIVIGSIAATAGYIGCWCLIQMVSSERWHLLAWLVVEVCLAGFRICQWSQGEQSPRTSLLLRTTLDDTVPRFLQELPFDEEGMQDRSLFLIPSNQFLPAIIPYVGTFPHYDIPMDVLVYYSLAKREDGAIVLYFITHNTRHNITTIYAQDDLINNGLRWWNAERPTLGDDGRLSVGCVALGMAGGYNSGSSDCGAESKLSKHYFGILEALNLRKDHPGEAEVDIGTVSWSLSTSSLQLHPLTANSFVRPSKDV